MIYVAVYLFMIMIMASFLGWINVKWNARLDPEDIVAGAILWPIALLIVAISFCNGIAAGLARKSK